MNAQPLSDEAILEELLNLTNQLHREGTTPEMIRLFEQKVGHELPPLFALLLQKSNGGEWCFGRFEINPFVHPQISDWSAEEVWEDLAEHSSLLKNPHVNAHTVIPFCSDYGEGMYCFDYRKKSATPPIIFISFGEEGKGVEEVADSFPEFVLEAIAQEKKEIARKSFTVELTIPKPIPYGVSVPVPELAKFGVLFEFIENQFLAEDEKKSSFADAITIEEYADAKRTVVFTMYDPKDPNPSYGVLQTSSELTPIEMKLIQKGSTVSNGSGIRYLDGRKLGKPGFTSYCVWHLSSPQEIAEMRLQMTFTYSDEQ